MKHLCILLALFAATTLWVATEARAAEPAGATSASSDPNFRWHNNQWWYWQAPQQRWMVWDGSQWQVHEPRRVVRSYSYMQDSPAVGTQSFRPRGSASGGRITSSFGQRDAGSKIRGNY